MTRENNLSINRFCSGERIGWLPLANTMGLPIFIDSGYPEKNIVNQSLRDVSVNYATDEFHINFPECYSQVANIVQFSLVRVAGAFKTRLHPNLMTPRANLFYESVKIIPEVGEIF